MSRAIPIAIKGEAHEIHVDMKYPQETFAGVDFGAIRVAGDSAKQLILKNTEKYDVKFEFCIKNDQIKRLVNIIPEFGVLPVNKEITVMVRAVSVTIRLG